MKKIIVTVAILFFVTGLATAQDFNEDSGTADRNLRPNQGLKTDDQEVKNHESENKTVHKFETEVNRMMKLIINSLYRNKEIFLRELISNASDALDKIRLLALTIKSALETNPEISIRIKADKENKILSITDTGVGMTRDELIKNLGTIAKSGTAEFLNKMQETSNSQDANDMIGQFGVGFYSAFLVANKVVVTTKSNDDKQYIWESDSSSYSIMEDVQGNTLKRGTTVSLYLKDEATDYLEPDTLKNLINKYSQYINFPIYLWMSKTVEVDEEPKENEIETSGEKKDDEGEEEEEDAKVEESTEEVKKEKVKKTVWDWEKLNDLKPIWTLKPSDISDEQYNDFYKAHTKDHQDPLAKIHFNAEGEVTFKSLLFIPKVQPSESFNRYGTKTDNIKLYVRRVFISDKFNELMPNYLAFIQGIVDSDDLPLNVSRENLQQHKLIKIIKKKLIRKVLDTLKKLAEEDYSAFWKEYSTNIKLGIIEDSQNRARLSKLLRFHSSAQSNMTSLEDYVSRMKPDQKNIYYIAGTSLDEVKKSPFTETLLQKGYEVLYLTEAVDEYALSSVPEFDGNKFQNVAKEGFKLEDSKLEDKKKKLTKTFEPLIEYLNNLLKDYVSKVQISERLRHSSCALVASMFGWTGNMERLAISNAHQKADDPQKSYYLNQKKTLEINPRHPLIRELLRLVENNQEDENLKNTAFTMFHTATLRSGFMLREPTTFADKVEKLMQSVLGVSEDEYFEDEEDNVDDNDSDAEKKSEDTNDNEDYNEDHDEL